MVKKIRLFGNQTPWNWAINLVYGCNLRCGHCCRCLDKSHTYSYMTKHTWVNLFHIIKTVSPTSRIDICMTGEPTLHPKICQFLRISKKISPLSQIQITTNGTILAKGTLTYRNLFDAGANIVYTDMYAPKSIHEKLAKDSGIPFYKYYETLDKKTKSPWTYHGDPDLQMIILQEQPENWPSSRKRAGLLGTWLNNLDWEAARRFNLYPVKNAISRRCNQPFTIVPIHYTGEYLICCQDGMGESAGLFGNVNEKGVEGFKKYWFGKKLQLIRRNLRIKNRKGNEYCSRCNITFSRCDYKLWTLEELSTYYTGKTWRSLPTLQELTTPNRLISLF